MVFFCFGLTGCVADNGTKPRVRDGKLYGVTKGLFQGEWYHYYERGVSFAEGHFWPEAERDFREALKQREGDHRRARTHGIHFTQYFPYRELGIALFYRKHYDEAVDKLERSLGSTKSAKAEYYLDKTRKILLLEKGVDQGPPEIVVTAPGNDFQSNRLMVNVAGIVRDDTFVKSIRVNGNDVRIDLAQSEVDFESDVLLKKGENTIVVAATDLVENSTSKEFTVHVDRSGPVIILDKPILKNFGGVETFVLKSTVQDETALSRIRINGENILKSPTKKFDITYEVALSNLPNRIVIEASDSVGNQTVAEFNSPRNRAMTAPVLLASAGHQIPYGALASEVPLEEVITLRDNDPPAIKLNVWDESDDQGRKHLVHLSEAVLSGEVEDEKSEYALWLNGKPFRDGRPGQINYFSTIVSLDVGPNPFHFEAWDKSDNKSERLTNIERKVQEIRDVGSRMGLVILPFQRTGSGHQLSAGFERELLTALQRGNRFRMKTNLGVDIKNPANSDQAADIGRRMGVSYALTGEIVESRDSKNSLKLDVFAAMINTDSREIVTTVNVYGENIKPEDLRRERNRLIRTLWIKLQHEMPLLEGKVCKIVGEDELRLDFGKGRKGRRLKAGMHCILFFEEVLKDPETGLVRDRREKELGKCIITEVKEKNGYLAKIYDKKKDVDIKPDHFVITK